MSDTGSGKDTGMDTRIQFNRDISKPDIFGKSDPVTHATITRMSARMQTEGVGMTEEHAQVLKGALVQGKPICETLRLENKQVLSSQGPGFFQAPAYNVGYAFHKFFVSPTLPK